MRAYRRLRVRLRKRDLEKVDGVLRGGIQAVRVVLRALALCQLHEGKPVSEVAFSVRLTPKAVREIGRRYGEWNMAIGMSGGFCQAIHIGRKALLLRAWLRSFPTHKTILH